VIIQGSLVFSQRQSVNYEDWLKKITLKPISAIGNGILKTNSTLNQILGSLGIFSISSALQQGSLLLIVFLLSVLIVLNILAIWNLNLISPVALLKPIRRGMIFVRPTFRKMIVLVYNYYDLLFPICLFLSSGSISCRWIEIEQSYGANDSVLSRTIFTSTFIAAQVFEIKDEYLPVHVNFLHDDIRCLSNSDIILKACGVVLFVGCLILRVLFAKLRKFSRCPLRNDSSLDDTDTIQDIVINLSLVLAHLLSVVLPSNRTPEQVEKIKLEAEKQGG
jgi:hypothetical protein